MPQACVGQETAASIEPTLQSSSQVSDFFAGIENQEVRKELTACFLARAQEEAQWQQHTPTHSDLRKELLLRKNKDQETRNELMEYFKKHPTLANNQAEHSDLPIARKMMRIDKDNREWLDQIVETHGWPSRTMVGADGCQAAWLLVQHADKDREFQRQCLALMQAVPQGEVSRSDIAYLVDRVRIGEGKKQLYGTQMRQEGNRLLLQEVEEPEGLEQRRKAMGLPSMKAYWAMYKMSYGKAFSIQSDEDDPKLKN